MNTSHQANQYLQQELRRLRQKLSALETYMQTDQHTKERLYQHITHLELIRVLTLEIMQELHLDTLLHLIVRRASELVGVLWGGLYLWEPAERTLVWQAAYGLGMSVGKHRLSLGEGLAGAAAQQRQGLIMSICDQPGRTAALAQPLLNGTDLLGVITCTNQGVQYQFTEDDRQHLMHFATPVAVAIQTASRVAAAEVQPHRIEPQVDQPDTANPQSQRLYRVG